MKAGIYYQNRYHTPVLAASWKPPPLKRIKRTRQRCSVEIFPLAKGTAYDPGGVCTYISRPIHECSSDKDIEREAAAAMRAFRVAFVMRDRRSFPDCGLVRGIDWTTLLDHGPWLQATRVWRAAPCPSTVASLGLKVRVDT